MSRRGERAAHLAHNRRRVVPPPHRGAADLRVVTVIQAAAVEQAEQVVGGQWPVSGIERARFGRRHRGLSVVPVVGAVAGQMRCQPEPGPEAARRQAGRVRRHLPAEPAPPGGILRIRDGAAARGRREPGRVIRFRRPHRHGRQLGEGEQLALERLLAAEQDAGLGVHDQLDAVAGRRAQARPGPDGTVPGHGRHSDRLAAAGGDRAAHVQGEPGEQASRAQQGRNRQPRAVLEAERRQRRRVRRPERPGLLAVRSVGVATMVALVLQAVPPAGRDQQGRVPPVIAAPLGVRLLLPAGEPGRSGADPNRRIDSAASASYPGGGPGHRPARSAPRRTGTGGSSRPGGATRLLLAGRPWRHHPGRVGGGRRERQPVWSNYARCRLGTRTACGDAQGAGLALAGLLRDA